MCLHQSPSNAYKINMCNFLINKNVLYILFLVTYCCNTEATNDAIYTPRGARSSSTENDAALMAIALPEGFRPQAPPFRPMLLPFATPAPSSPFGGWKPIFGAAKVSSNGYTMPMPTPLATPPLAILQDRMDAASQEQNLEQREGPALESIVYGTWKPEPPLGPNEMQTHTRRFTTPATAVYKRKGQSPTAFEELGVQHPIANARPDVDDVKLFMKNGSRRVTVTRSPNTTIRNKFIQVNISDPNLLDMAKQINESLGGITTYVHKPKNPTWQQQTEDSSHEVGIKTETESKAEVETETMDLDASKVWPTDFIASVEQGNKTNPTPNINDSFSGANDAGLKELWNGLHIPNSLLSQNSLNITKVGVPYEKQSSDENPTICVPLTVLEQLNHVEVLEVERVYCFPLPPTHTGLTGTPKPKSVIAKVENLMEYEAVNSAKMLNLNYVKISSLIILNFLKLKIS